MSQSIKQKSKFREYAEALITALLVAFVLRAFVIEAFKVPSASMVPSILIGDHLFVNKFAYGLRVPLTKKWFAKFDKPERGEIAVFIYPRDESKDFIKRIIGMPGDHVVMNGRQLSVNDEKVKSEPATAKLVGDKVVISAAAGAPFEVDPFPDWQSYEFAIETLGGRRYVVQYHQRARQRPVDITVPADHFFVVGDNRNRSSDSREWGFIPLDNLKGRAMFVWLSWDALDRWIRPERFGHWLN